MNRWLVFYVFASAVGYVCVIGLGGPAWAAAIGGWTLAAFCAAKPWRGGAA